MFFSVSNGLLVNGIFPYAMQVKLEPKNIQLRSFPHVELMQETHFPVKLIFDFCHGKSSARIMSKIAKITLPLLNFIGKGLDFDSMLKRECLP
jgi:hypothetical protein